MKRFSKTLPITKGNLTDVPEDKPAVIRIKDPKGKMWAILAVKPGRIAEEIWMHRGDKQLPNLRFQYRTTATMKEAAALRVEQINEHVLPFLKVR